MPVYVNSSAQPRAELTDVIMQTTSTTDQFIGLKLFPSLGISQVTAHVPKINRGEGNLDRATTKLRAPGSNFQRWHSSISDYSVTLVQVAEEVSIPDETRMSWEDYFDVESMYTAETGTRLQRGHEIDAAAALFNTSNFATTAASVAYTAANLTNGTIDFVGDIDNAIRRGLAQGNRFDTIVMSGKVFERARSSTILKAYIAGTLAPGRTVTDSTIVAAWAERGIKNVFIGDSYVNQSSDGDTNGINQIWPDTYIFVGKIGSGPLRGGGFGRTFFWDKEGEIFQVFTYRDEPKASNIIRGKKTTSIAVTNDQAGTLITTSFA